MCGAQQALRRLTARVLCGVFFSPRKSILKEEVRERFGHAFRPLPRKSNTNSAHLCFSAAWHTSGWCQTNMASIMLPVTTALSIHRLMITGYRASTALDACRFPYLKLL